MTIGALLLQPAGWGTVAAPPRPPSSPAVAPAAAAAAVADVADREGVTGGTPEAMRDAPPTGPLAVILYSALGFPALLDEARQMSVLLVAKPGLDATPAGLAGLLGYREWRPPALPSGAPLTVPAGNVSAIEATAFPATITEVFCKRRLGRHKGVVRLARPVLDRYRAHGFTQLVSLVLTLPATVSLWRPGPGATQPRMYALSVPDEEAAVHEIIKALPRPFSDCPTLPADDLGTLTLDGQPVRMLHPFCAMTPSYLGIAHMTDMHLALRWDLMEQRLGVAPGLARDAFNNPNKRFVEHLEHLRTRPEVAIGVLTGDVIDYNRGWDGVVDHRDIVQHYLYNRDWVHFYDLITKHYYRPFFIVAGNHEWRLNPYAPLVSITGFKNLGLWLPLLLGLTALGWVTGLISGIGAALLGSGGAGLIVLGVFILLAAVAAGMFMLLATLAAMESAGGKEPSNSFAAPVLPLAGLLLGFVIAAITAVVVLVDLPEEKSTGDKVVEGLEKGMLWGTVSGVSLWLVAYLAVGVFQAGAQEITDVMDYTNLMPEWVRPMLPEKFEYIDMLGADSNLATMEGSVAWYNLIINPFYDYSFAFKKTAMAFLDWNRSEDMFRGAPPTALDSLSDEQWDLVNSWVDTAIHGSDTPEEMAAVLALHATVFSPRSGLKDKATSPRALDSGDIDLATLSRRRQALVTLLRDLPVRSTLSLSGHTHVSDVFMFDDETRVKRVGDAEAVQAVSTHPGDVQGRVMFITSTCSCPIGTRAAERPVDERKPQYRRVQWSADGRPASIEMQNRWPVNLVSGPPTS